MKQAEISGLSGMSDDVVDQMSPALQLQTIRDALFEERGRSNAALNAITDAVLSTDRHGYVTYLNAAAESMTGWSLTEAWGQPLDKIFRLIEKTTRLPALNRALRAIQKERAIAFETNCLLIRQDGTESAIEDSAIPTYDRYGQVVGAVIVFHAADESPASTRELAFLAHHDFLTGLPNRALLVERLQHATGQARRHGQQVALLFLDIDFFKKINDSLGHTAGDQVLVSVAQRLTQCVRDTDTVSRQGGDEFVVLLTDISGPTEVAHIAEKLMAVFTESRLIEGQEIPLTLSIGISLYPADGSYVDNVLENADKAMYHAKAMGRNNYQFFEETMNTRAIARLHLESELRSALRLGEFELTYQPQVELATGKLVGAEVLIRWNHPERGLLLPEDFIPIAEDCGLIINIGHWVLYETCRQIRTWLEEGLSVVPLAVNISATEFNHGRFLERVRKVLRETGVAAKYIQMELTENLLMQDTETSVNTLKSLEAMGIQLAIDDFGMGCCSLAYLKRFPIQTLKIDPSFVRDVDKNDDESSIVSTIIGMGKNLKQHVLAEGVETSMQFQRLREQKCDIAQGYYFSRPLDAHAFSNILQSPDRSRLRA